MTQKDVFVVSEVDDAAPTGADLLFDLESAQSELEGARERIAILLQDDKAGVSDMLWTRVQGMESRVEHLLSDRAAACKKLDYYSALLMRLKQLLKVETNAELEPAVRALLVGVA